MKITEGTKISELIKFNPKAIDVIASINRHFEKLRNPILRKILASRVTIADAAKIGHSHVDVFFEKLSEIGFIRDIEKDKKNSIAPSVFLIPENAKVTELDVTDDIARGKDPFLKILNSLELLAPGEFLALINSFEPLPLISILTKKNYPCMVKHERNAVVTYIAKLKESKPVGLTKGNPGDAFDECFLKYKSHLNRLDVSEMEMPGPMVAILSTLEDLPEGNALHVKHRKVPQLLFPELKERGFEFLLKENESGSVELLIFK